LVVTNSHFGPSSASCRPAVGRTAGPAGPSPPWTGQPAALGTAGAVGPSRPNNRSSFPRTAVLQARIPPESGPAERRGSNSQNSIDAATDRNFSEPRARPQLSRDGRRQPQQASDSGHGVITSCGSTSHRCTPWEARQQRWSQTSRLQSADEYLRSPGAVLRRAG